MYNLYNLEATSLFNLLNLFTKYLTAEKITKGSIRSYLSDVRYFLNWLVGFLKENHVNWTIDDRKLKVGVEDGKSKIDQSSILNLQPPSSTFHYLSSLLNHVNQKVLEAYKDYQASNNIPTKTINRRFSALRKFGSFCQNQNWSVKNPFDALRNISPNQPFQEENYHLGEFRTHLWQNNSSRLTIKNYLNDVKQFIAWQGKNNFKL